MWSLTQSVLILSLCSLIIVKTAGSEPIKKSDATENLEQSSLICGIFKEILRSEESECAQDVKVILDGIHNKDVWALKSKSFLICLINGMNSNKKFLSIFEMKSKFWTPIQMYHRHL